MTRLFWLEVGPCFGGLFRLKIEDKKVPGPNKAGYLFHGGRNLALKGVALSVPPTAIEAEDKIIDLQLRSPVACLEDHTS